MPDRSNSDMVMQFVQEKGGPVMAECALRKDNNDEFMDGFTPAPYNQFSNFFEVTKFSFGLEVVDEDTTKTSLNQDKRRADANEQRYKGGYLSWRSATDDEIRRGAIKYPLEFDTFAFSRKIDSASPIFFDNCLKSVSFKSATLVKRVAQGHNRQPLGFMQIKFTKVLIIGVDWDDGDLVTENCKFICRSFELRYRQQSADGTLGSESMATWDPKAEYKFGGSPNG